jgi:TPR repeat protein
MLFHGEGIDRDLPQAVKLWTWAAERGDAYAQFDLAEMYLTGAGVRRDLAKAYSLFALAGKTMDVSQQLNEVSSKMNFDEIAETQ